MSDAARLFGQSLPPGKYFQGQEALRFARWFGEDRPAVDLRPADIEAYVESFGANSPNAAERAECLKNFLAFAHKQKILPERMVSHVRLRRGLAKPRSNSAAEARPEVKLTPEGKAALERELQELKARRPHIAAELRAARADGDVRENAPLEAAREAQGQLEARIRELEAMLRNAVVEEQPSGGASDRAHVGSNVVIANLMTGARLSYQLVNVAEARPGTGRLSIESPVGQALVGKRVGDEVQVAAPSGVVRFRIEAIEG